MCCASVLSHRCWSPRAKPASARLPEIWSSIATSSAHPERARRGQHDAELTDAQAACLHRHEEIEQGAALKRRRARPNLRDGGGA